MEGEADLNIEIVEEPDCVADGGGGEGEPADGESDAPCVWCVAEAATHVDGGTDGGDTREGGYGVGD